MTLLTAAELADMRATQALAWPDVATHLTPTSAANALGEAVVTWGTAGTAIACRLAPVQAQTRISSVATEVVTLPNWVVTMAYSGTVNPGDQLVISSRSYEVLNVKDDFGWRTALRIECIAVEK